MNINKNLYGYWKMIAMRFRKADQSWESEEVLGGASVFTESGQILTYTRTSELGFGYNGTFEIKDNVIHTRIEVCSIPELEGTISTRTIKKLSADSLVLGMFDEATGRDYEIELKLVTNSFTK